MKGIKDLPEHPLELNEILEDAISGKLDFGTALNLLEQYVQERVSEQEANDRAHFSNKFASLHGVLRERNKELAKMKRDHKT